MQLCFLGNANSPHLVRWAKFFADQSNDVSIISLGRPKVEIRGIRVFIINTPKVFRNHVLTGVTSGILQIKKILKKIQPDILHAHSFGGYGAIASLLEIHPLVISAWGSDVLIYSHEIWIKEYLTRRAIQKADLLHCDGVKTMNAMVEFGATPDKIIKTYFGIDSNNFNPNKRSIIFRKKLGLEQSVIIISLRSLEPIYNIETLLRAVPLVIKEIPNAKFVIASHGSLREKLETLVRDLGVSYYTIFTGRISDVDFPFYIASSDIYVSTSLSDGGLASSTGEAMACGLPVIVTEDPDNREWIDDGINGYIIPKKSFTELAKRIIILANNKKLREKFGKLNREIIKNRNNYKTEMKKIEMKYKELSYSNYL